MNFIDTVYIIISEHKTPFINSMCITSYTDMLSTNIWIISEGVFINYLEQQGCDGLKVHWLYFRILQQYGYVAIFCCITVTRFCFISVEFDKLFCNLIWLYV